jgi:riboflavin synthase
MFTGLIQETGSVVQSRFNHGMRTLVVKAATAFKKIKVGDSVAINGCCLTIIKNRQNCGTFELVPETLKKTTLGTIQNGMRVNLELPLRMGEFLGGHWVQGHIDGIGVIHARIPEALGLRLIIRVPKELKTYIVTKGSIAIDGVSLTVAKISKNGVEVALIPETIKKTILGDKGVGDSINIEVDSMAKYFENFFKVYKVRLRGQE